MPKRFLICAASLFSLANLAFADYYGPFSCQLQNNCAGHDWNASAFNVVTLGGVSSDPNSGNYSATSDVGGGIAVFHNLTNTGSPIDSQDTSIVNPYTSANAVVVDGQIAYGSKLTIGNNRQESIYCANSSNCNAANFNPSTPAINSTEGLDFASARTALQTLSTQTLANYAGAKKMAPADNGTNYVLNVKGMGAGLYVVNVDALYFSNQNRAFEVDLDHSGQTVVINIINAPSTFNIPKGTVINYGGTQVGQTTTGGVPVVFNVVSPSVLTVNAGGSFIGSLLAPSANFTGNSSVDGQLLIATLNNQGEIHDQYFNGSLDALLAATPEPSTWMMFLGCGLFLYNLISKRFSSGKQ